jgi:phosphatidylglycerophosphatase A
VSGVVARKAAWVAATWFGCGLSPWAPGTVGTLGTVPLYLLLARAGPLAVACGAVVATFGGVWAASVVVRELSNKDPQVVVIDEVAGTLVTLLPVTGCSWRAIVAGLLLFRVLDVLKPGPVRALERLPSGWGVVMDDIGAGIFGAALLGSLRVIGILH